MSAPVTLHVDTGEVEALFGRPRPRTAAAMTVRVGAWVAAEWPALPARLREELQRDSGDWPAGPWSIHGDLIPDSADVTVEASHVEDMECLSAHKAHRLAMDLSNAERLARQVVDRVLGGLR